MRERVSVLGVAVPLNHECKGPAASGGLLRPSCVLLELKRLIMAATWLFLWPFGAGVGRVVPEEPLLRDRRVTTGPEDHRAGRVLFQVGGLPGAGRVAHSLGNKTRGRVTV